MTLFGTPSPFRPPVVSAIEPSTREPGLAKVKAGRRTLALVRIEDLQRLGIVVGQEIDAALAIELDACAGEVRATRDAMLMLVKRASSSGSLLKRLARRGHSPDAISRAMARLREFLLLDDAAGAESAARDRSDRKPGATSSIAEHLAALGFDPDAVENAIGSLDAESDLSRARRAALQRFPRLGKGDVARRRRLASFLMRRGFDDDLIDQVVREFLGDSDAGGPYPALHDDHSPDH